MLDRIPQIFAQRSEMMKKLKKNNYETNMQAFRREFGHYFDEMTAYVDSAPEGQEQKAADELAACFTSQVLDAYGKKGKIKGRLQADMNLFMIYYVFTAIQMTGHPQAKMLCDRLCSSWNRDIADSDIGYTDYDTIYNSFREKIFGIL